MEIIVKDLNAKPWSGQIIVNPIEPPQKRWYDTTVPELGMPYDDTAHRVIPVFCNLLKTGPTDPWN
jgi:hypothetical protein